MQLAAMRWRVHHAMAARAFIGTANADVRQEHQGVFQALALVQGDDLHAARVRFQPQLLGLVIVVGIGDAACQPVDQAVRAERAGVGFLQQLGQLQVVGETAFAIDQGQQALPMRGPQIADQGQRAAALPAFAPVQRLLLPAAMTLAVVFEGGNGGGVFADQHGGQRGTQAAVVARVEQGLQQGEQFQCFVGGEQALLAGRHRRNAHRAQRLLDARGLAMTTHQHRDVAGLHRAAVDAGAAVAATGQPTADGRHAGSGAQLARAAGAPGFGFAFRGRWRRRRAPQRQCRGRGVIALQIGVAAFGTRLHRMKRDALGEEGLGIASLRVQRVDGRQHAGARAEVVLQRRRALCGGGRSQIGLHVATAEAVDGLLGVADQGEQARRRGAGSVVEIRIIVRRECLAGGSVLRPEHAREDLPLAVVGVLEFVHQRNGVLRAQPLHQRFGLRALQCASDAIDQVVVGLHAALALALRQLQHGIVAQRMQQADAALPFPLAHHCIGLLPHGERVEQRRARHAVVRAVLAEFAQALRQQFVQMAAVVQHPMRLGTALPQLLEGLVETGAARAAAIENLVLERSGHRVVGGIAMRTQRGHHGLRGGLARGLRVRRWCGDSGQQFGLLHQRAQVAGQGGGAGRPQRHQIVGHGGIGGALPPQVGGHLAEQFAVVGQQLRRGKGLAAFQRVFAQHARAKAVDGEDGRQVDFFHRLLQAAA